MRHLAFNSSFDMPNWVLENTIDDLTIDKKEDKFIVNIDMPGVDKEDISVSVDEDVLRLKATRKKAVSKRYDRTLYLPKNADIDNIDLVLSNGVLTITIPTLKNKKQSALKVR